MAHAEQYIEKKPHTEAEYFEFERTSFGRWEYVNGQCRLMAGGTPGHSAITSKVARALGNVLVPRGCRIYGSDVKIHTGDGANPFPDVSVFCGTHRYYAGRYDVLLNPQLVVEVLSPSTKNYDRTEKFEHYQTIETLTDCLLVEQGQAKVMLYTRRADYWEMRVITGLANPVFLPSVDVTLSFSDMYALIEFEAERL